MVIPCLPILALGQQEGDFQFQIVGDGAEITGYVGSGGEVAIPDRLGGRPVTSIGPQAFYEASRLTSVTIPGGVTNIGWTAFSGCTALTNAVIPGSVTTNGFGAFSGCTGLIKVTIGNGATSVGSFMFGGCTALRSISIPDSVTTISEGAFTGCAGLTNFPMGSGVITIEPFAFVGCTGLTHVIIPDNVFPIPWSSFSGCSSLTSIKFGRSVGFIDPHAFASCERLTTFEVDPLNSRFSSMDGVLFNKAKSVLVLYPNGKAGSYDIPPSVIAIELYAFMDCTGLAGVTIPNTVAEIGQSAFLGCTNLKSVAIPDSVTDLADTAFVGCTGLTSVTISGSFITMGYGVFAGCTGLTNAIIGDGVASIPNAIFTGCTLLASIVIPNSVTSIESGAFFECTSLRNVVIPDSVTGISQQAFSRCRSLTNATIGNGVTNIQESAFSECTSLKSIAIPDSVIQIGDGAFSGCTHLMDIQVGPLNSVFSSAEGVLFSANQSVLVAYPGGRPGAYVILGGVTEIRPSAFAGCAGLTSLRIPASTTSIWASGLSSCTSLIDIDVDPLNPVVSSAGGVLLNNAQTYLLAYPGGRTSLDSIPSSVTSIWTFAFSGNTSLTNVRIPDSVISIEECAFSHCPSLQNVTIPASLVVIQAGAFEYCAGLIGTYFEGDRPRFMGGLPFGPEVFEGSPFVTLFYRAGTMNWESSIQNHPTAVWMPRAEYADWVVATGLAAQFPNASGASDDPDGDGFTNRDEWLAGTEPTQRASRLELELAPRAADLTESDRMPIPAGQHAVYFRSVPGRYYGVHRATALGGAWELQAVRVADATQTRFLLSRPETRAFYRIVALP